VLRTIPGLERAEFARLGGIHRNTFINSPRLLDSALRLKQRPDVRFAGQITGVEGYVESAAMGLMAGRMAAAELLGASSIAPPPATTAHGALVSHITGGHLSDESGDMTTKARSFQPMNVNFGLFPDVQVPRDENGKRPRGKAKKPARQLAYTTRAKQDFSAWLQCAALSDAAE
jgi:methylenetetrahydrofolate--tRNA-(uracil-5-)-methyltransferase